MNDDTIAAIATPIGSGGIGIVRISGPKSLGIAGKVFRPIGVSHPPESKEGSWTGEGFTNRRLHYGRVVDPEEGRVMDEVLLAVMRAPHSYTCEDVVEIQAHAGQVVLRAVLALVLKLGARLAEPGEFTRRAFLNGRIDLTQAEALIDLINAKTEKSLQLATGQLAGSIKAKIDKTIAAVTKILAEVEAAIDFPEETEDILDEEIDNRVFRESVIIPLAELVKNYDEGHLMREGLRLVILGRPNVGKSSLMNRLLEKDRAIVTPIPGTTRDTIEEVINIQGLPVVLVDTAGVHESSDPVEKMGIERSEKLAGEGDLILLMVDASAGITRADAAVYDTIKHKPIILIVNKIDLETTGLSEIPRDWDVRAFARTSVKNGTGMAALKETIIETSIRRGTSGGNQIVPNMRQKRLIEQALAASETAMDGITGHMPPELIAIDLKDALTALNAVLGVDAPADILDEIFKQFCIGK